MADNDSNKNLPTRAAGNSVDLHNSGNLRAGSLIDQSLTNLTPEQRQALVGKAAEEALRLEAKARNQNLDYVVGKKVVEDHIEAFEMLNKDGKLTRHAVTSDVNTGAGKMRIESKSGATCFVATAAYGDADHPDVAFLRHYRDTVLMRSPAGRRFIAWYWVAGPQLARWVAPSPSLRACARWSLGLLVRALGGGRAPY